MRKINLTATENQVLHGILNRPIREMKLDEMMKLSKIMEKAEKNVDENDIVIDGFVELEEQEKDLCLQTIKDLKKIESVIMARIIFSLKEKLENAEKI